MVQVTEFRIPMPLTTEEYQRGQLYGIAELSKESSQKNGEGVEVLKNEPYEDTNGKGQYTKKIYHLGSSLPTFVSMIIPSKALDVYEEAWSAFPYCKTVITAPFLGDRFSMTLLSMYKDNDDGNGTNVLNLGKEHLAKRKIVKVDIVNDDLPSGSNSSDDPRKYKSQITGRGPLTGKEWLKQQSPSMYVYKVVIVEVKVWGLQSKIEAKLMEVERSLFLRLHRRMFCSLDQWINLTMDQIRSFEDETQKELKMLQSDNNEPTKLKSVATPPPGSEAEAISVEA
jgi:hypothetical protein